MDYYTKHDQFKPWKTPNNIKGFKACVNYHRSCLVQCLQHAQTTSKAFCTYVFQFPSQRLVKPWRASDAT